MLLMKNDVIKENNIEKIKIFLRSGIMSELIQRNLISFEDVLTRIRWYCI